MMFKCFDVPLRALAHAAVLGAAVLGLSAASGFAAAAPAKVVATVNGATVTDEDVRNAIQDLGAQLPAQLQGPAREAYVVDYLIDLKLAAQQADKDKLGETPAFARQLAYQHGKLLMERLLG